MNCKQKVIFIQCSQRVLYVHAHRVLSIMRARFLFYVKHVLQYVNGHAASVEHPRVHKAFPGVLLVMAISLLSMPDGSCMSVRCGPDLALPLHRSTSGMV